MRWHRTEMSGRRFADSARAYDSNKDGGHSVAYSSNTNRQFLSMLMWALILAPRRPHPTQPIL